MRAIVSYALLRAALFVAPFAILVAAQVEWYVALVIALLFAFAASAVFLRRFKVAAVAEIARMRGERGEVDDEDAEDAAVDRDRSRRSDADEEAEDGAVDGTVATTTTDPDLVADDDVDEAARATDAHDDRSDRTDR